jgi:sulfide:quinone oxidoreductase
MHPFEGPAHAPTRTADGPATVAIASLRAETMRHSLFGMAAGDRFRVVIAGGGVAGLEAALALRDLAGERVQLTLLAPEAEFVHRPQSVGRPLAYLPARRYAIAPLAQEVGATLLADSFSWVDAASAVAHTAGGAALPYDALLLAIGARTLAPFANAITIDDRRMDTLLAGLVRDVEEGHTHSVALIAPGRAGWLLPIYELALMIARRARELGVEAAVTVITPEAAPLENFGPAAGDAVRALAGQLGVTIVTSASAQVPEPGRVILQPSDQSLDVDRVVALPELYGPAVRGLPAGDHGFIAIDHHAAVVGAERVFAAGDVTEYDVKQSWFAAAQADAAAEAIAALAGAELEPAPFDVEIRGVLMTGADPVYLSARLGGTHEVHSHVSSDAGTVPGTKIMARYLGPYLERRDRETQD